MTGPLTIKPGLGLCGPGPMRPYCWLGERRIVPPENWSGSDTATAWLEGFAAGVKQSAAPELLEACKAAADYMGEMNYPEDILAQARAAIAKAVQS